MLMLQDKGRKEGRLYVCVCVCVFVCRSKEGRLCVCVCVRKEGDDDIQNNDKKQGMKKEDENVTE